MFKWIYSLFESWFGSGLNKYLAGYDCVNQATNTQENLFSPIGISTLIITGAIAILYYYAINSTRFNRWWSWVSMLGLSSIINAVLAFFWINGNYNDGSIQECLIKSDTGAILIDISNIIKFGLGNFVISVVFFIIISAIIKWGSRNCKYSPL
jgi:hypothetical protein